MKNTIRILMSAAFLNVIPLVPAGSATWKNDPANSMWSNAANWTPATVPNGPADTATFEATDEFTTPVVASSTEVDSIIFDLGSPEYYVIAVDAPLEVSGAGVFNNSGTSKSFTVEGVNVGARMRFSGVATAVDCDITVEGAFSSGDSAGLLTFSDSSSAGNAILWASAGLNGGEGAVIEFNDQSTGGTARIALFLEPRGTTTGTLSIYNHQPPGVSIGSLEGGGLVLLGAPSSPGSGRNLTVGVNGLEKKFSGVIKDEGNGGSLTKVGPGKFILSGANLYGGGTLVKSGTLVVSNATGSGTGTGPVKVNRGRLGGPGTIAGAVTVGRGTGSGAELAPGIGASFANTLTIQSTLTFKAGGAYAPREYPSTVTADQVSANGVTIESGALFALSGGSGTLPPGTVFTVISNTAATPIAGSFSNLADGSTITVGSNTFQANYEGGDGNDLALTVVP